MLEEWLDLGKIPHPPGRHPQLLDAPNSDFVKPMQKLFEWSRELGPLFETQAPGFGMVVASGADVAKDLFDDTRFEKYTGFGMEAFRPITGDGLFTARNDEENWALAHHILMPAFSKEALARYHDEMVGSVAKFADGWADGAGGVVDIGQDATRLSLDIIGRAGFGYDFGTLGPAAGRHPYVDAMVEALAYSVLPPDLQEQRRDEFDRWVATLNSTVDGVIEGRKARPGDGRRDLLDAMLTNVDPETGRTLPDENVRYQITTFMVAGYGTVASLIAFGLMYLYRHPSALQEVRDEASRMLAEPIPTFEETSKLRALRRVIDETLRLWPPSPAFLRVAKQDTVVGGRYRVAKGGWAAVLTRGLHHDPLWGEDRAEFRPSRFESAEVRTRPAHIYKPFGTGPRMCIGRQFALHSALIALSAIVGRFDIDLVDGELSVVEGGFFMPEHLKATVSPRLKD